MSGRRGEPGVVLAMDLGTGSVKAGLVTPRGEVQAQASARYPVTSPQPGWSETRPAHWWRGVVRAVREVMQGQDPQGVRAVGLSGQMHGVVLCGPGGRPLRSAVLWSDTRSAAQVRQYAALPVALQAGLGNPPVSGFAGPSLLWLRDHEPGVYGAARWALSPKDWLRLHLTAVAASEPSDASGTLLYDLNGDGWYGALLGHLDLNPALLPPLRPSGSVAGTLQAGPAAALGLPAGVPVVAGAADTAAALLGSGLRAGEAQLTVGTGAQVVVAARRPPASAAGVHVFRDAQAGHYTLAAVQNAGNVLEWVRATLRLSWPQIYAAVSQVEAEAAPLFLPYLTGDRTPHLDPQARAGWLGLGAAHDRRHLVYAAFEGVALSVAQAVDALGLPPGQPLQLAGGGTQHPWWRQMLSSAVGRPLEVRAEAAASLLGAGLLAWRGLGISAPGSAPADRRHQIDPRPEEILPGRRAAFAAAYAALRPVLGAGPMEAQGTPLA